MKANRGSTLLCLLGVSTCPRVRAKDEVKLITSGTKYEVVGPLFAYGIRDDLGKQVVSTINIHLFNFSGPEVAWKQTIPLGTVLTIVGMAPPPSRFLWFLYHDRYLVTLNDLARDEEVPVVMEVYGPLLGENGDLNARVLRRPIHRT